jgi:aspartate racemase
MKTIGLLGGMTCESSAEYYRIINETVREKLGGIHSAKCLMYSFDFAQIDILMEGGKWEEILGRLINAAQAVERGGADFLVLCTNTMHKLAAELQSQIKIPILNIIDVTAEHIKSRGFKTVGLLGTRFTMEEDFYKDRLTQKHGLTVLIPDSESIQKIHRIIVDELSIGDIRASSKTIYWEIMNHLKKKGAEGIILGCTEIPLLVTEAEGNIPLLDTTRLHAQAAVEFSLKL